MGVDLRGAPAARFESAIGPAPSAVTPGHGALSTAATRSPMTLPSRGTRYAIAKLADSLNWYREHYSDTKDPVPVLIHPTNVCDRSATPAAPSHVVGVAGGHRLVGRAEPQDRLDLVRRAQGDRQLPV